MKGKYTGKITDFMKRVIDCMAVDAEVTDGVRERAVKFKGVTAEDLADLLGLSPAYVRQYGIAPLHEAKIIRVGRWDRNKRGCPSRVFFLVSEDDDSEDAPRIGPLPWSTTNRRWRERKKAGIPQANNSLAILARGFKKMDQA